MGGDRPPPLNLPLTKGVEMYITQGRVLTVTIVFIGIFQIVNKT